MVTNSVTKFEEKNMKRLFILTLISLLSLTGFAQQNFGAKVTKEGAKPASELSSMMKGKKEVKVKLTGKILEVCQKKGCWMKLDLGNGQTMRITFKDYAFFIPKNAAGKTVVIEGVASWQETSVEELKHYAKDAGKSQAEIDAIKEAKRELVFEADGVLIL